MERIQIFLSAVSAEFGSYREALRRQLDRPNVTVKIQEDFVAWGTETLEKLDDYIRSCDAVIHLIGDMTGDTPTPTAVQALQLRYSDLAERLPVTLCIPNQGAALSYTHWESYLAVYHKKSLIIAVPEQTAPRDVKYTLDTTQQQEQAAHLIRLRALGRHPEIVFANVDRLAVDVLRSQIQNVLHVTHQPLCFSR